MDLRLTPEMEAFRDEVRGFLEAHRDHYAPGAAADRPREAALAWQRLLIEHGYAARTIPKEYGGYGAQPDILKTRIIAEEFTRAGAPRGLANQGISMLVPTLLEVGSEEQKQAWIGKTLRGEVVWCQGYSEPGAGSDLANVKTRARFEHGKWLLNGQKVWTSLAHESQWCFVIARTDPDSVAHAGLGFFLVKMDQPGVTVRPIEQITGTSEFNEVFFDDAVCEANDMLGKPGDGWQIGMALLGFERGVSTLGQQMLFQNELDEIVRIARENGRGKDPVIRQRIADAWIGLRIMRFNAMRMLSGPQDGSLSREATAYKLYWAVWHRNLGKLAMDVLGPEAEIVESAPYELTRLQSLFLFTRSDTIYGGTNQIQRNIIAERALGMPREPRPAR